MGMTINGVTLAFDMLEAEDNRRVTQAVQTASAAAQGIEPTSEHESIRTLCGIVFACFNEIFGEGTDKQIFGETANLRTALEAFDALVAEKDAQMSEFNRFAASVTSKYSPNRAARRTAEQK